MCVSVCVSRRERGEKGPGLKVFLAGAHVLVQAGVSMDVDCYVS